MKRIFAGLLIVATVFGYQNCGGDFKGVVSQSSQEVVSGVYGFLGLRPKAEPTRGQSISRYEYLFAVQDLLGDAQFTFANIAELPADPKLSGFESAAAQTYDESFLQSRLALAELVAASALQKNLVMICTLGATETAWQGCPSQVVNLFATRAFRRPPSQSELLRLQKVFEQAVGSGQKYSEETTLARTALKTALTAVLMSPNFQMRNYLPSDDLNPAQNYEFQLASHLSWSIASSIPDWTLMTLASKGQLSNPVVYKEQVKRLLTKYNERFSVNVFGQWFGFRDLAVRANTTPIEKSMVNESIAVFKEILKLNLSVKSILEPGFTFVDPLLADHYGIRAPAGEFGRVETKDRGGILTQGSILRLSSSGEVTKPIVRGKWVQYTLLCRTIPTPSPEIFAQIAAAQAAADPKWSVSERLNNHRRVGKACQGCHELMDPLGLGLEAFNAVGQLRAKYNDGKPVISNGDLDGKTFAGPNELSQILGDRSDYRICVAGRLLTHALARPLAESDIRLLHQLSEQPDMQITSILESIFSSPEFFEAARRSSL